MTTHTYHPDSHEFGLQDDCPRCAEHSLYPWQSLDSENLANLKSRIGQGLTARSGTEAQAMEMLLRHEEFLASEVQADEAWEEAG